MAWWPVIPPLTPVRLRATHRMIASRHSESGSVLAAISDNESMLADLAELDGATNDRLLGEEGLLPGISVHELVYGVRYASIVNAAFTHKNPAGSRFNDGTRGAWYAGVERATSIAEVAYHRARQLANIDWPEEEISTFDDYLADFTTEFHDLRGTNLAGTSRQPEVPEVRSGSGLLCRIAAACKKITRNQIKWVDLSECPPCRWNLHRVLSSSSRLSCTAGCQNRNAHPDGRRFDPHAYA